MKVRVEARAINCEGSGGAAVVLFVNEHFWRKINLGGERDPEQSRRVAQAFADLAQQLGASSAVEFDNGWPSAEDVGGNAGAESDTDTVEAVAAAVFIDRISQSGMREIGQRGYLADQGVEDRRALGSWRNQQYKDGWRERARDLINLLHDFHVLGD